MDEILDIRNRLSSVERIATNLSGQIPSEAASRQAWIRESCLGKALQGREGWAAVDVIKVAEEYYNWVITGKNDYVPQT